MEKYEIMNKNTLYQTTLLYIAKHFGHIPHQISKLPWDVYNDVVAYRFNDDNVRNFYTSISRRQFQIATDYLRRIRNNVRQNDINYALHYAIVDEQFEYVKSLELTNFKEGIICTLQLNNANIVYRYINLGFDDWNFGLIESVSYRSMDMINYFITDGATDFTGALVQAIKINDDTLIDFFY